jgi:hypothetical protein
VKGALQTVFIHKIRSVSLVLLGVALFGLAVVGVCYQVSGPNEAQAGNVDNPPRRVRWEYKVLNSAEIRELTPKANDQGQIVPMRERFQTGISLLGLDGWELAACTPGMAQEDPNVLIIDVKVPEFGNLGPISSHNFIFKRAR